MPNPVNYNERILIVGKTRSGKSVLAKHFFEAMTGCQRVAIDPKGTLELEGAAVARNPQAINWDAPVIHYVPSVMDKGEYEELYRELWQHRGPPMLIWLDEAMGPTMAGYAPQGLNLIVQQGGGLRLGHFACSQRPQNIAMGLRSEAEHIFLFVPPPAWRDLTELAHEVGMAPQDLWRRMRDLHAAEGDHSFLWYCRATGELTELAPLDIGAGAAAAAAVDGREPELEHEPAAEPELAEHGPP